MQLIFGDARYLTFCLEYIPDGDLSDYRDAQGMCTLPQSHIPWIIRTAAVGINYLHRNNVVHNDINPSNIFLHPQRGGVIGVSGVASDVGEKPHLGGTIWYMGPEMSDSGTRGQPSDMFAFGVTVAWLLRRVRLPDVSFTLILANIFNSAC